MGRRFSLPVLFSGARPVDVTGGTVDMPRPRNRRAAGARDPDRSVAPPWWWRWFKVAPPRPRQGTDPVFGYRTLEISELAIPGSPTRGKSKADPPSRKHSRLSRSTVRSSQEPEAHLRCSSERRRQEKGR